MKILVLNCGSSSLKYQVLDMTNEELIAKGLVERIGIDGSIISHEKIGNDKVKNEIPMKDHTAAISQVIKMVSDPKEGAVKDISEIAAVGHRVVHAGENYAKSVLITDEVIQALEACVPLAPLHNPANLTGINVCKDLLPEVPMVAVFDTAFHQTMPPEAYIYALPYKYYEDYSVRRYGFHGTSHFFVSQEAAKFLSKDINDLKLITCHLGNGASVTAIKNGKSVATSMGFTPLEGVAMGTRAGNIDPAIIDYLKEKEGLTAKQVTNILNKESGVLGISGVSSDFRDINDAADEGNERAQLAQKVFAFTVKSYIGSYIAQLNGVDAIVFTAGVGENDWLMRSMICENMNNLGITIDEEYNKTIRGKKTEISTKDSKVKVIIVPTNEELVIARDTLSIISSK